MIIIIILFSFLSEAYEIEVLNQKLLFSAKNFAEFQHLDLNYKYLKSLQRECDLQNSKQLFPRSCYLAVNRAAKLGLLSNNDLNQIQLDKSCTDIVQKIYNSAILSNFEKEDFISPPCKRAIRDQIQKLKYIHSR